MKSVWSKKILTLSKNFHGISDKIQIYQDSDDNIDGQARWLADDLTAVLAVFDIKGFLLLSLGLELVEYTGVYQFLL